MISPGLTLAAALRRGESELAAASDTPHLDASVLLCHAGSYSTTDLIARAGESISEEIQARYEVLIRERRSGRPVAQLTGQREFWSLQIAITPDVLIPRPETELLVEAALGLVPVDADWRLADLGTGSGAIALALARERPCCRVTATDLSAAALQVADSNRTALDLEKVELLHGSWFEPLGGRRFRLLVSNPPYVAADDPHLERGDV
ncbi:MAG: HemK/PrmC family methyltransferase, partial [Pseudomonadota bacterium]|nr:HemK/PrmC family methyltransferase [Pseudomonadota bacterium]